MNKLKIFKIGLTAIISTFILTVALALGGSVYAFPYPEDTAVVFHFGDSRFDPSEFMLAKSEDLVLAVNKQDLVLDYFNSWYPDAENVLQMIKLEKGTMVPIQDAPFIQGPDIEGTMAIEILSDTELIIAEFLDNPITSSEFAPMNPQSLTLTAGMSISFDMWGNTSILIEDRDTNQTILNENFHYLQNVVLQFKPIYNSSSLLKPSYITFGSEHTITNFENTFEWVKNSHGIVLKLKDADGERPNGDIHLVFPKDKLRNFIQENNSIPSISTSGQIYISKPYGEEYESNFRFNYPSLEESSYYWYTGWPTASYSMLAFELDIDGQRPAISGQENFVTNVDDPKTVAYFQSFLTAIDDVDGDVSDNIYVVTDNYTTNKFVLGRWSIVFGVEDSAGNESTLEVFVNVVDLTAPVITGNTSKVQISYTQTYNIANFKSTLAVTDNYDTLNNSNITIKSDGYTSNITNLGTYNIVFEAVDQSGNVGTFTKQVEVIDDVGPTWSGPATLTKPSTTVLTINDIISQLTATDAKEGNVSSSIVAITDNYTGNGNKAGSYTIVFEAQDSKGNKTTHTVTVQVNDNIAPIWYIQDGVSIVLAQGVQLTHQQIIDILAASGQIQHQATTTYTFPVDNYSGNETEPGVYTMQLHARSTNGNEYVHEFAITVMEGDDDGITIGEAGNWIANNIIWILLGIGGASLVIYLLSNNNKTTKKRRK